MRKILAVAANDLRLIFSDGSAWVNLLVVPIVLALVIGYSVNLIAGGSNTSPILDVVDLDQTSLSQNLVAEIARANPDLVICLAGDTVIVDAACKTEGAVLGVDGVQSRLEDEVSTAYLEIPAGLARSVAEGGSKALTYRTRESVTQPSEVYGAVEAAAASAGAGIQAQRVAQQLATSLGLSTAALGGDFFDTVATDAQRRLAATPFALKQQSVASPSLAESGVNQGFAQAVPGMGSMYAIFAVLAMAAAWVRDNKQGVIRRARTMSVSEPQLLGGKVLAYFTVGMIQISVLFLFGYVLGLRYGSNPVALVAVMASFALAATGLALLITSLVTTEDQAQTATILAGLVMASIGGAWWSLEIVPAWMQTLGYITPIAWAMDGYHQLIYRDAGWSGVALPVVVLLGMALLFFMVGLWRMRASAAE